MDFNTSKRGKEKKIEGGGEDRISALPDSLLHRIFSTINTVDAVRTCVLSKRWRYFWTSLPYLIFDSHDFVIRNGDESMISTFVHFINGVIKFRDPTPIIKFGYDSAFKVKPNVIQSWVSYAIKHKLQNLQLLLYCSYENPVELPSCLYGCDSLLTLELSVLATANICLPASFGLPSLKSLHLQGFSGFDGSVFSTCPSLETLKLQNIDLYDTSNFSISAPNLKSLDICHDRFMETEFYECKVVIVAPKLMKFKYEGPAPFVCSAENLISLDQVEIDVYDPPYSDDDLEHEELEPHKLSIRMFDMLNQFHSAKSMELSLNAIMYLSFIPSLLNDHPSPFSNLKCLKVTSRRSNDANVPTYVLNYFRKGNAGCQFQMVATCKLKNFSGVDLFQLSD